MREGIQGTKNYCHLSGTGIALQKSQDTQGLLSLADSCKVQLFIEPYALHELDKAESQITTRVEQVMFTTFNVDSD